MENPMSEVPTQTTAFDLVGRIITTDGEEYLNKSNLKVRGWTEALIREFLGRADASMANPKYRYAAPQQLFLFDRVKRAEEREDFQAALDRTVGKV